MFFKDYCWRKGRPFGINALQSPLEEGVLAYKIVADPYLKRLSVESYRNDFFEGTIYDSTLLDFRSLMCEIPPSWERSSLGGLVTAVVRDICDRAIWTEEYAYEGEYCRLCRVHSAHGLLLSTHRLFYTVLGDKCDGVILYDAAGKAVFAKRYDVDEEGAFSTLLEENWEIDNRLSWFS